MESECESGRGQLVRGSRWLGLLLGVTLLACHGPSHEGVLDRVAAEESTEAVVVEGVEYWLDGLRFLPSEDGRFFIRTRTDQLVQYPCARCHEATGSVLTETSEAGIPERAHRQILQPHGEAEDLTCTTCHVAEDPSSLSLLGGPSVGLDQSYDLCATCHFEQRRDWQAGAHGKRLAAWSGPRVIESCTGCHDPHAPAFEVRLPATLFRGVEGE